MDEKVTAMISKGQNGAKIFGDGELLRDLRDEADLCANEGVPELAGLLNAAADRLEHFMQPLEVHGTVYFKDNHQYRSQLRFPVKDGAYELVRLTSYQVNDPLRNVAGETWDFTNQAAAQEDGSDRQRPFCYHDGRNVVGTEHARDCDVFPLYTHPQEPLSESEIALIYETPEIAGSEFESPTKKAIAIARAVEKVHGITGGGHE